MQAFVSTAASLRGLSELTVRDAEAPSSRARRDRLVRVVKLCRLSGSFPLILNRSTVGSGKGAGQSRVRKHHATVSALDALCQKSKPVLNEVRI